MKQLLLTLLFVILLVGCSQKTNSTSAPEVTEKNKIKGEKSNNNEPNVLSYEDSAVESTEEMPMFPGGDEAMKRFIARNIVYPKSAIKKSKHGTVYVAIIIEKDGSISDIKSEKSFDDACAAEVIRVIKKMPRWVPGKMNGKPIRVRVRIPVKFKMS